MKNIVSILEQARNNNPDYNFPEIIKGIKSLKKVDHSINYDWDESDEEWVSLLKENERVAIIGVKIPVIFVVNEFKKTLDTYEFSQKILCIEINDFDEVIWSIDLEEYESKINEPPFHASSESINLNSFSTNDFWWATI